VQSIDLPVASQEIIKELGTNGGGFFNVNSAMPFENANGLTNFLEMVAILSIPASLTYTYGRMVGSRRQGWTIFGAMFVLLAISVTVVYIAESHVTPAQHAAGIVGANMEGKEVRFGTAGSALWTAITTATSTGAVNSAFESLTGIGGLVPMVNLSYGESVFGGVGTGLYTMLLYALLAVFIGGLMVGRTPEYLGKKIESFEVKMASLALLISPATILLFAAVAVLGTWGTASILNAGPHGLTEILYAYTSQTGNNGSAFAGLTTNTTFYNLTGGIAMLIGRFLFYTPLIAIAGSMARKKTVPASLGTFPTTGPTFTVLLVFVIIIVAALTFFPAYSLGPVIEQLLLGAHKTF
jgi:potassium-transporting ATPase potassium-binding subunit